MLDVSGHEREKGADFLRIIRFLSRSFLCQHLISGEVMEKGVEA